MKIVWYIAICILLIGCVPQGTLNTSSFNFSGIQRNCACGFVELDKQNFADWDYYTFCENNNLSIWGTISYYGNFTKVGLRGRCGTII